MQPDAIVSKIVKHFQLLFDVRGVEGVLPRMNEVYLLMNESVHFLRALRSVVGLEENSSPQALMARVESLVPGEESDSGSSAREE